MWQKNINMEHLSETKIKAEVRQSKYNNMKWHKVMKSYFMISGLMIDKPDES